MHWEKIPLEYKITHLDGKEERVNVITQEMEKLKKQGIPYRMVRTKEPNGKVGLSIEKQVEDWLT